MIAKCRHRTAFASAHRTFAVAAFAAMPALACRDAVLPTVPPPHHFDIADGTHGETNPHFFFLPPLVEAPHVSGTFDADLAPTVEICLVVEGSCASLIARFTTMKGSGSETVRRDTKGEHYLVNWHTDQFNLDPAMTYRIVVRVGEVQLGFADVQLVRQRNRVKIVNTGEFIDLVNGRTLPIKFRIEQRVVASITVSPPVVTIARGRTQAFVAVVTDLHGMTLSEPVSWTQSDGTIVSVDDAGVASALSNGTAIITASAGGAKGTAQITVREPVAHIVVTPGTATLPRAQVKQFVAVLTDINGNTLTQPAVTWTSSVGSVATVSQSGLAEGLASGNTTIAATADGVTGSAALAVREFVTLHIRNWSQYDINQVWTVTGGNDLTDAGWTQTLWTNNLSDWVNGKTQYNDEIVIHLLQLHDPSAEPNVTPYDGYLLKYGYQVWYVQERLTFNDMPIYYDNPVRSPAFVVGVHYLPGYTILRETLFLFDPSGYPIWRYEQVLRGPDGKVYLYRPWPGDSQIFFGTTAGHGPILLETEIANGYSAYTLSEFNP